MVNVWNDVHTFSCLAVCLFDQPHQFSLELMSQLEERSRPKTAQVYAKSKKLACHIYPTFLWEVKEPLLVSFVKKILMILKRGPKWSKFLQNQGFQRIS